MKPAVLPVKDEWAGADALMAKAVDLLTEDDKAFYEKDRAELAKGTRPIQRGIDTKLAFESNNPVAKIQRPACVLSQR